MSIRSCGCDPEVKYECLMHYEERIHADLGRPEELGEHFFATPGKLGPLLDSPEWQAQCSLGLKHGGSPCACRKIPVPHSAPVPTRDLGAGSSSALLRKQHPVGTGVLDYFRDALLEVAYCSYIGNEQHNPGEPLHWAREKSTDEADALIRHFLDRGTIDTDGVRHSAKMAWRALALLQKEIEAEQKS